MEKEKGRKGKKIRNSKRNGKGIGEKGAQKGS